MEDAGVSPRFNKQIVSALRSILRAFWLTLGWLLLIIGATWAFGALWFDFPIAGWRRLLAILFLVGALLALLIVRPRWRAKLSVLAVVGVIGGWWLTLKPNENQHWQPDVAQTGWAEINGDEVTLHNVRNCEYRTETDYTPRWETRTVRLSRITGLDLFIMYWGSPLMAHPIASFRFVDAPPICFSVEARKQVGQKFSPVASLYRQAGLVYVVADERDSVRVRTNHRHGEDVYLYRILASREQARERFLEYLNTLNALHNRSRWYNVITTNCTTSIREQRPTNERMPWDWRILVNGKGDEMLYERHLIASGGLAFAELKQRSRINERARDADKNPDFSRLIREGLPGFDRE